MWHRSSLQSNVTLHIYIACWILHLDSFFSLFLELDFVLVCVFAFVIFRYNYSLCKLCLFSCCLMSYFVLQVLKPRFISLYPRISVSYRFFSSLLWEAVVVLLSFSHNFLHTNWNRNTGRWLKFNMILVDVILL